MSKALGDSALKALKAWVKSYVGTAVQGGGYPPILSERYI